MSSQAFVDAIVAGNTDDAITSAKTVIEAIVAESKLEIQAKTLSDYGFAAVAEEKTEDDDEDTVTEEDDSEEDDSEEDDKDSDSEDSE